MDYSGAVTPGGPAAVRELPDLTISKLSVGPMDNNAYLLRCRQTGQQLLVDAANDADQLLSLVGDGGLDTVVTTHRHQDHWLALSEVLQATGADSVAHPADADPLPAVTRTVSAGDTVRVGECSLEVIHLVGHTPGSIALLYQDPAGVAHLFTGDSLFPGGPGRTTNSTDFETLMDDLEAKIFGRLPDDTWFYPGHGNDSTLGFERAAIPEWRARGW
ncbi:MBL fold metallo-hydrolase [Natronosporangium hydrolyticum]|uniref:MBL fold metallo-hydrolase n=1 Tax=Natronosporangium hydrolyticum TaxID=2811111 RepID=A0A895YM74_9ACTN|nr:MBL fold metallo-hydrolase [Natronosporangium hydrolyticum]QSB16413.1 MBL fold metallo-hydrolase [Natronosporangium hydrolyticum]